MKQNNINMTEMTRQLLFMHIATFPEIVPRQGSPSRRNHSGMPEQMITDKIPSDLIFTIR